MCIGTGLGGHAKGRSAYGGELNKRQLMPDDLRSDEDLILADRAGETNALDILFRRYDKQTHFYLLNESLIKKDDAFLEDIKQEIFLKVLTKLRAGAFKPAGDGSFRAWFYTIAQNICQNYNYWRIRGPKNIYGLALDLIPAKSVLSPQEEEEKAAEIKAKLSQVLAELSPEETALMQMLGDGMTYKQIQGHPEFAKHSIDYLGLKVYNIRKKIRRIKR